MGGGLAQSKISLTEKIWPSKLIGASPDSHWLLWHWCVELNKKTVGCCRWVQGCGKWLRTLVGAVVEYHVIFPLSPIWKQMHIILYFSSTQVCKLHINTSHIKFFLRATQFLSHQFFSPIKKGNSLYFECEVVRKVHQNKPEKKNLVKLFLQLGIPRTMLFLVHLGPE